MIRAESLYIGGIELYTIRDSLVREIASGLAGGARVAAAGRRVGQRGHWAMKGVTGEVIPAPTEDVNVVRQLLRVPGVLPVRFPNGNTYPMKADRQGHEQNGFQENRTGRFPVNFLHQPNVVMADLPWKASTPGQWAFSQLALEPYAYSAGFAHLPLTGWAATGTSAWDTRYIEERGILAPRLQATLVADVTLGVGASVFVGFRDRALPYSPAFAGNELFGVHFESSNIHSVQRGLQAGKYWYGSVAGRWTVIVTMRPMFGRVEVWAGKDQLFLDHRVAWTQTRREMVGCFFVHSATAYLHQWYVSL